MVAYLPLFHACFNFHELFISKAIKTGHAPHTLEYLQHKNNLMKFMCPAFNILN